MDRSQPARLWNPRNPLAGGNWPDGIKWVLPVGELERGIAVKDGECRHAGARGRVRVRVRVRVRAIYSTRNRFQLTPLALALALDLHPTLCVHAAAALSTQTRSGGNTASLVI